MSDGPTQGSTARITRIAHLTDLHFGAEDAAVVAALSAELRHNPPDLVAVSGDLTQGARVWEFQAATGFLNGLGAPWIAVPGNHDISPYRVAERFLNPYATWRREVSAETEPVWCNHQAAVIGLNTAQRMGWGSLDWSRGRVSASRLARLVLRLGELPRGLIRIVLAHHPLLGPEGAVARQIAGNADTALAAFARNGVRLVLAGHLHHSYSRLSEAAPGDPGDAVPGPSPLILQGGSATSVRLRGEPNAYNIVTVDTDGALCVEGRVWNGAAWQRVATARK